MTEKFISVGSRSFLIGKETVRSLPKIWREYPEQIQIAVTFECGLGRIEFTLSFGKTTRRRRTAPYKYQVDITSRENISREEKKRKLV